MEATPDGIPIPGTGADQEYWPEIPAYPAAQTVL
jgi:hypothetical protein